MLHYFDEFTNYKNFHLLCLRRHESRIAKRNTLQDNTRNVALRFNFLYNLLNILHSKLHFLDQLTELKNVVITLKRRNVELITST